MTKRLKKYTWKELITDLVLKLPARFTLDDVYRDERQLSKHYPKNHFVREKIRQVLQQLRDSGLLNFEGAGSYIRLKRP